MGPQIESEPFVTFIEIRLRKWRSSIDCLRLGKEWLEKRQEIRRKLIKSLGGFPKTRCDLDPQTVGRMEFADYTVEKVVLQTLPGVRMMVNLYRPSGDGPFPAVLCVHGHWKGVKQIPPCRLGVSALAKLGFVALAVDAFGAGERAIEQALGEYHGEMTAATLYATGRQLAGVQVYENMRCADYLQSRPDVDGAKLAITGTSGGGNQTMYANCLGGSIQSGDSSL